MYTSCEDRTSINDLYSLGAPSQLRDASQPSSSRWKKEPTKINTPSNGSRTPSGNSSNPFGSAARFNDTLRNGRGNLAAQQTLTGYANNRSSGPPPNKKPRVDNSVARSRKKVPQPSNSASRPRRLGDPDDTDIIIVDDEYEDLGQRLVESDDLNISGPSRFPHSTRRNSHPIADGPATTLLRRAVRLAPEDDRGQESDDPIESFEPSEISVNQKPGNVQKKVQKYEKLESESLPRLDFSTMPEKPNVKRSMKPKNPTAAPPIPMNIQPKPNPTNRPSDKRNLLPIKAWYLGRKLFEEPYHLMWTQNNKLIIRSGDDPNAKAKHSEEIDIGMVAGRISFQEASEQHPNKIFVLETLGKFPKSKAGTQKPFGTQYSEYFKQGGNRTEGEILIKFDSSSPAWVDTVYERFIQWLQGNVDKREKLRGKAGEAKWEAAKRMSQITNAAEARIRREADGVSASVIPKAAPAKSPAISGIPPLNDWSPPPAIANTARAASRPEHQGSPGSPIEVGSPTRAPRPYPGPRSLNRHADSDTAGGGHEVRRSARQSVAPQRPQLDPDEVILVYPPGQTGAVNITNGDVTRLAPGEFLNDTLIEFGLKLWLQDLEKENPELVKQIHVFSSFFYKKLNKKNPLEGYESVRKWTSRFNLFDKKYIIVPINENLHWYLAIIYQPEHTLKPPPPTKSPSTRRKTRQEAEHSPEIDQVPVSRREDSSSRPPDSKASSVTRRSPTPAESAAGSGTLSPSSNMQAEAEVLNELTACSITEDDASVVETPDKVEACETDDEMKSLFGDPDPMDVDAVEPMEVVEEQPPPPVDSGDTLNDGDSHTASEEPANPEIMDVDAQDDDPDQSRDPLDLFGDDPPPESADTVSEPVKAVQFYGSSAKSRGKRKAVSPPLETFPPQETHPSGAYEDGAEDGQPLTYVFTLDSLGTRHPKVTTVLGQYLRFEAQERKGIPFEMSRKPIGKAALVPHQPNFCDCGIYLLHLAQTFISDPSSYYNMIIKQKGNTNSLERQIQWKDEQTKSLRQSLAERISELSIEWKKNRAAQKELEKTQQQEAVPESSDDDVDIVDTTPIVPPQEKTPKTGRAMRMRG